MSNGLRNRQVVVVLLSFRSPEDIRAVRHLRRRLLNEQIYRVGILNQLISEGLLEKTTLVPPHLVRLTDHGQELRHKVIDARQNERARWGLL
jgi:DNA-binding MarR family transcriptional regulator